MWPALTFYLVPGIAWVQAGVVSNNVGRLPSWSVQVDSPGPALTVGAWIRPGGQNQWSREEAILTQSRLIR